MIPPLRLAYLIFVHQNPPQLARLIKRLASVNTTFYIYVDAKANRDAFRAVAPPLPADQLIWLSRTKAISWGNFSLSAAYLTAFRTILEQGPLPHFIVTLSGQDYPLATNSTIQRYLAQHLNHSLLDHALVPTDASHLRERVEQYYLAVQRHHCVVYPHPRPDNLKRQLFNTALHWSGRFPLPRQLPLDHQLYFGTNWFQLSPQAVGYLVDFAHAHPDYLRFFRRTYVPEEMFFQTVLLNASESERGPIYNQRLTFMQWDRAPGLYPSPIVAEELPAMLGSHKLFARKFDFRHGSHVLDQLDHYLDRSD